ncbi:MAG: 1,4-dihydroxy-2-naphthoate polyprenyltransferase [Deltaproteobacteria bacterium]|nr:1,4-dihydroxy-2-naphthoate polyprenyltransferase [Deltaproteobacteria bacterium]
MINRESIRRGVQEDKVSPWVLAIRPKTLPASISPVLVGTSLAFADGVFRLLPALACLAGALLLQIGVNLSNDYFDFVKEVDTPERLGPVRVTQSGLVPPGRVKAAIGITFLLVVLIGLYLVLKGGWPILAAGIASILAALGYSGGPYPLGSHGLGDLLVFIFFGIVAVCGTYYVQALGLSSLVLKASFPVGLLITAILVVNNLRDIETDRKAGKKTLAVILGKRWTRIEYVLLLVVSYAIPIPLVWKGKVSGWVLLVLITLPMGISMVRRVWKEEGQALNSALSGTARLTLVFSLLFSIGIGMK